MNGNSLRTALLAAGIALSFLAPARAGDDRPAWPQENGPFGNFNPRRYGVKLVDDPALVKLAWVSEEHDLGMGRAGTGQFGRLGKPGITPGTSTGLILAEGKVFASSIMLTGD